MTAEEFAALFVAKFPVVRDLVAARGLCHATAEDVAAEAFLRAWVKRADLTGDPGGYVTATAKNLAANHLACGWVKYARTGVPLAAVAGGKADADPLVRAELAGRIAAAAALAPGAWELLDGYAGRPGSADGALRAKVVRARAKVRALLGDAI
jgi:DNA-directed RNA polymerase specialized sigma24 family protein